MQANLPEHYSVDGRFAIQADGKGSSASFAWRHMAHMDRIDLQNPLGQVVARLEWDPQGARLFQDERLSRQAESAELLLEQSLGWRLPITGLRFWLLGLADPTQPAEWSSDKDGRQLKQAGWLIHYPNSEHASPNRIKLSRPNLEVRIALHDWQFGEEAAPNQ